MIVKEGEAETKQKEIKTHKSFSSRIHNVHVLGNEKRLAESETNRQKERLDNADKWCEVLST